MEDALTNLQQITNHINDSLWRLAEGQVVTLPQHERPRDHPARQFGRGIQITKAGNRDQHKTQQERYANCTSKGKSKVTNLPQESGTESSSTNRDHRKPSKRAPIDRDHLSNE
ncbi:hypothetical protein PanWU01x14_143300 [Parasponia andersonii]|uniref:Uncharacterized protein n=1 Tax=Parasponia andersonii TaxID=3476 RepID=A0A2P5CKV7_PARAD|nr:hypothetical protein PanWU01x14_143300 [Parasponia andersonii]